MKHTNDPITEERFRDLQYLYLEDLLAPKERAEFDEHLKSCPDCSGELKEMSRWVAKLKEDKEALCPDAWEIYEHVRSGEQVPKALERHMETCDSCAQEAQSLKAVSREERMPRDLWAVMAPRFRAPVASRLSDSLNRWFADLTETFLELFRAPVPAFATVAVAVLLAVALLYPTGGTGPAPLMSSIRWNVPLNLMGARPVKQERVATIIFLKGFKQPFKEERIDSLYGSLAPTREMDEHFDFVSPADVKEAVTRGKIKIDTINNILQGLSHELNVSRVVALTLTPVGVAFGIEGELVETRTGKIVAKHSVKEAPGAELSSRMKTTAKRLLFAK